MIRTITRISATVAILTVVSACSAQIRNHGYAPTDEELAQIIVGVDSRATVEEVVGRPSTSGVQTNGAYYYLSDRRRHYGFEEPRVIDRQLVAISFGADDTVTNIERFTLEDGRVVPLSRRVTDSSVQNTPFLRQLLGSVGRFNPANLLGGTDG